MNATPSNRMYTLFCSGVMIRWEIAVRFQNLR